jgi:undecaprenyl-phosphate 4-deoxy-4-formamido-L-arabinose transferase
VNDANVHSIAVVVPVYMGAETIERLADELLQFRTRGKTQSGTEFVLTELVFAHDCGPDNSDEVIRRLTTKYDFVRAVWLSRNFGQHAATLAGMASTSADWIITMDEDGQHDPNSIGMMLDQAVASHSQVVYGAPTQSTAHGRIRNLTSVGAKRIASLLSGSNTPLLFSSYRLISGEIGRSLAAYAGPSVYLDVALSWIANRATVVNVNYREERRPNSGYSYRRLLGHFWKLAITTGTRPLRYVSIGGGLISLVGIALAIRIVIDKIYFGISATGWASVVVAVMTLGGFTLLALGVIAEYIGLIVRSTFGQPTYLAIRDPKKSPVYGIGSGPKGL